MHLAQKVNHLCWIQDLQHLLLELKICIIVKIGDISCDCKAIWRKKLDTKPPTYNVRPIVSGCNSKGEYYLEVSGVDRKMRCRVRSGVSHCLKTLSQ